LPYDTYFDENKILSIKDLRPIDVVCGSVNQYYKPEENKTYIIAVDCQEEGSHFNGIVVYCLEDKRICAD
jgi:hypothetical protein